MVNRERVQLLVDALRSGEYEQARGALIRQNHIDGSRSYCCLGVACVVAAGQGLPLTFVEPVEPDLASNVVSVLVSGDVFNSLLPPSVMEWFGFDEMDPYLFTASEGHSGSASVFNDEGSTFEQLADMFEEAFLTQPGEENNNQ
jgi:hypothetical protein